VTAPAPAPDSAIRRIAQIALTIQDLDRAITFYRDTLGLTFLFQAPPGLAFFDCAGIRLMLSLPEGNLGTFSSVLYYEVGDIEAAAAALTAKGVAFESAPHVVAKLGTKDLWMGFFRDSEGNLLGVMQEK
jgi:methylmalonyl-CoA/ethylmalonyl-CoA epimerase